MFALSKDFFRDLSELSSNVIDVKRTEEWSSNAVLEMWANLAATDASLQAVRSDVGYLRDGLRAWTFASNVAAWTSNNLSNVCQNTFVMNGTATMSHAMSSATWSFGIDPASNVLKFASASNSIESNVVLALTGSAGGCVGVGTSDPQARLHVHGDALKPGNGFWSVACDRRLKENIDAANLDVCYSNVKSTPLKSFTWRQEIASSLPGVGSEKTLGWVAQDVEHIFASSVQKRSMYGYDDCRAINADQLFANMFGALQKMQGMMEQYQTTIQAMTTDLDTLCKTISVQQQQIAELQKLVL